MTRKKTELKTTLIVAPDTGSASILGVAYAGNPDVKIAIHKVPSARRGDRVVVLPLISRDPADIAEHKRLVKKFYPTLLNEGGELVVL